MGLPYKVFLGHHRTSLFIADAVRSLANISEQFRAGRVYNIGGHQYHDMKSVSDQILAAVGRADDLVEYVENELFTTRDKKVDISLASREIAHDPRVTLEEGIALTLAWMQEHYPVPSGQKGN